MSANPYGVKPGQVWADASSGREAIVVSVSTSHAYLQGLESSVVTSRKLDSFYPHCGFNFVREGEPLPKKTVRPASNAPYMTDIPDRRPQRKPHLTLGEAKKAVLFRLQSEELGVPCMVYQWDDKKGWERLWKIDAGTKRGDLPWHAR